MHCCLSFVTEPEGEPSAVLLRGLAPVHGLEAICRLRYGKAPDELTAYQRKNFLNGPGKCCQALGLDRRQNGIDLNTGEELFLCTALSDVGLPDQLPRPSPSTPASASASTTHRRLWTSRGASGSTIKENIYADF